MKIPLLASKLDLSNKGLTEIPAEIFKCKNLKKLNLSHNLIRNIPPEISKLKNLKNIDLSNNKISVLMAKFFLCKNLEVLIINNNKLKNIPKQIAGLHKLKKLSVAGNEITELTSEVNALNNLRSLNIANNAFSSFPGNLDIKNLKEIWVNKNPIQQFSAKKVNEDGVLLESLYCFSSMYSISENIDPIYVKLQQKKGNCLSDMKLFSLKTNNTAMQQSEEIMRKPRKSIFISYSHADDQWLKELMAPLKVLDYEDLNVNSWDDTQIKPGDEWEKEIGAALEAADIALLLVSSHFLASSYVRKKELPKILDNAISKGTKILPIVVRLCRYNESPLGKFQTLNTPNTPLNQMTEAERDRVYYDLCKMIEKFSKSDQT